MTTTPNGDKPMSTKTEAVMVPFAVLSEAAGILDCEGYGPLAMSINSLLAIARPATAAPVGVEDYDAAFKIASDLHAAYEQLIYGLPTYLDAKNLTDEENMIREAYITLDVTAHRLASLRSPEPGDGVRAEVIWQVGDLDAREGGIWRYEGPISSDIDRCPVCLHAFRLGELCAIDIEMGTSHARCLEGSPVVNLDTGEAIAGGELFTFVYGSDEPLPASPSEEG